MADQIQSFLESLSPPLQSTGQTSQFRQLLTSGMASYVADYLRPQTTAKLLANLMQSRKQGVWTNRDAGFTPYVSTVFNSGAQFYDFGQFIDVNGNQQMLFQVGANLEYYNLLSATTTHVSTSMPTSISNYLDVFYPLVPTIREFQTTVAGTTLYSVLTHPQLLSANVINSSAVMTTFQLNPSNTAVSGTWGYIGSPLVPSGSGVPYGYPAICEPFLNRMAYAGFPIEFQTNPPSLASVSLTTTPPSIYDIILTNAGYYNTCTLSSPLEATDGARFQVPAICGRPTSLKTIQLSNNSNSQALLVGCQNGVCLIQGTDATNFSLVILTTEFGIPSNRAIIPIQNDAIFLANDGIRSYSALVINANLLTDSLSYGLQDYVQTWDQKWLNQAFAVRHRLTKDIQFFMPQLNEDGSSTGTLTQVNAASFNGTNQYLSHVTDSSLSIGGTSFTWAGWIAPAAIGGLMALFAKTTDTATTGDYFIGINSSGYLETVIFNGSTDQNVNNSSVFGPFVAGSLYFVVAWYDHTAGTLNMQVNNGTIYTITATITPTASSAAFNMGAAEAGSLYFYSGIMQSVGFWKRTLLTSELTALYNNGVPLLYTQLTSAMQTESTTTFISYWNLNELTGTRNDSRTTANNLTSNNSVTTRLLTTTYIPAAVNLGFVFNYGMSNFGVQAIPQLTFTPSVRQGFTIPCAIEFQDPNNNNAWTMFGGSYTGGLLFEHYSSNLANGVSLPWFATFPLISGGNDATAIEFEKIHIICEGAPGQNFFANMTFFEMMTNGTMLPQGAQQGNFNLISGDNSETILSEWVLGQSALPGTYLQFLEYYPTGEGRYANLLLNGSAGNNIVDLVGAHYMLQNDSTRQ